MHPAWRVFDAWAHRMRASGELGTVTVATYRTIWGVWLDWLGTRQRDWLSADADLVLVFLNGPSPSLHHHRAAIRTDRLANFTQQRYWRVRRAVYAQAVESGWLAATPVLTTSVFGSEDSPEGFRATAILYAVIALATERFTKERIPEMARKVQAAATELSRLLGHSAPRS